MLYTIDKERCASWDSNKDFLTIQIDRSSQSNIWSPDFFIVNSVDTELYASVMGQQEEARIHDSQYASDVGFNIAWKTTTTVRATCDFLFTRFPFDETLSLEREITEAELGFVAF